MNCSGLRKATAEGLPVGVNVSEQSDQHGSPFQATGWTKANSLAPYHGNYPCSRRDGPELMDSRGFLRLRQPERNFVAMTTQFWSRLLISLKRGERIFGE